MKKTDALILVDVQKGFRDPVWGPRNNPNAEQMIEALISLWRSFERPIIHIQHLSLDRNSPLHPESSGSEFMEIAQPMGNERVMSKQVNSAFIGTELETVLRSENFKNLIFCGFTTDHCISTSVRMAKNLGFSPTVVADSTVAFDRVDYRGTRYQADLVHAVSLASLKDEFADIREAKYFLEN